MRLWRLRPSTAVVSTDYVSYVCTLFEKGGKTKFV